MQEVFSDAKDGYFTHAEPYYLTETQAALYQNANLRTLGLRKKRLGVDAFGAPGVTALGMGTWQPFIDHEDQPHFVGVWDNRAWVSHGDKTWTAAMATSVSLVANTLYQIIGGQATEYHGPPTSTTNIHSSFFCVGTNPWTGVTNPPLYVVQSDLDVTAMSIFPRCGSWWQGRLWLFNHSDPLYTPSTLGWSSLLDGWDIDMSSNSLQIAEDDGDEGMAILPSRGSAPRLYLFKKGSIYALDVVWGSGKYIPATADSLDTTNSRLVLLSEAVGCVATKTAVYTSGAEGSDIFFLSRDGVRSLKRVEQDVAGGAGEAVSEPVHDRIERINWTMVHKAVAAVHNHLFYLAIPVDGSTVNNLVLVFDLIDKVWVTEHTWTPTDVLNMADPTTGEDKLWMQHSSSVGETLTALGYTTGGHWFECLADSKYLDPGGAQYTFSEVSRSFFFQQLGNKKRYNWLEYLLEPAVTSATMTVDVKVDEGSWTQVKVLGLEPEFEYPVLPARLPWNFTSAKRVNKRVSLIDIPPGERIQCRIHSDSPSAMGVRMLRISAWPYVEQWEDA
jgi:hypothetical protein